MARNTSTAAADIIGLAISVGDAFFEAFQGTEDEDVFSCSESQVWLLIKSRNFS